jgi:hypothetical protein
MERTQRVAKLEALLARVQSRSNRGDTHGNAAVAIAQPARVAPAAVAAPVVQAAPAQAAPSPRPSPVAASTPPVAAAPPPPAPIAAHEMQEEVATVIRDVSPEALAAIAAATAQQNAAAKAAPAAGAPPPAAAAAAPPPAAAPPAASVAPAFRGTSAFGGLSKKMTLIGTAPPANWPPRGAEVSAPPPEPAPPPAAAAPLVEDEEAKTSIDEAPAIEATESEGDLDALLGDGASAPRDVEERAPALAEARAPAPITAASAPVVVAQPKLPVAKPATQSRSSTTVIAMIMLWLMLIAVIWFVYKSSM